MKRIWKQIMGMLLSFALAAGLAPGMRLTALAYEGNPYADLVKKNTAVYFNKRPWYIIEDNSTAQNAGTLTLLAADASFGTSTFTQPTGSKKIKGSNNYNKSRVKQRLDAQTAAGGAFADVKNAMLDTEFGKLYLISREEAEKLPQQILKFEVNKGDAAGEWWTRTPGVYSDDEVIVYGSGYVGGKNGWNTKFNFGIRPAFKLKLSSVLYSSVTLSGGANTKVSGSTRQNYFDYSATRKAMTTVTYTAKAGYKFPEAGEFKYGTTKGIKVERTMGTEVKVSGTPEGVVNVKVPDAVPITNEGEDPEDYEDSPAEVPAPPEKETPAEVPAPPEKETPAGILLNSGFLISRKGTNVQVKWGAVPNADTYEVYAACCGKKTFRKIKTLHGGTKCTIKKLNGKKLDRKEHVMAYVAAYRNGTRIGRTISGYCAGKNTKYTDAKKLKVSSGSYILEAGKTAQIKASTVKSNKKKKLLGKGYGEKYRYASSDLTVAAVDKKGMITAVGAGTCDIWVYAQNGRSKRVTVTVK